MREQKLAIETFLFKDTQMINTFRILWILGLLCIAAGVNSGDYGQFFVSLLFAVHFFYLSWILRLIEVMIVPQIHDILVKFRQLRG
jgi:hypothetical protein